MLKEDLVAATQMLTVLCVQSQFNFLRIRQLRQIAENGLSATAQTIYKEGYAIPDFLRSLGNWHFSDPTIFSHEKRQWMADEMTKSRLSQAQGSIDAASLVFGHSVLDDLATEICKIIAVRDPISWESALLDKKVTLAAVRQSSYEELYRRLLDKHLNGIGKQEPLAKRIDLIHQRCPPSCAFMVEDEFYKYDSAKIIEVDLQRQEIIHRVRWECPSPTIIVDIDYLDKTCRYLIWLVATKYTIQIDLPYWFRLNALKQRTEGGSVTDQGLEG